jgi:hypothetical protein
VNIFAFFCTFGFVCAIRVLRAGGAGAGVLAGAIAGEGLLVRAGT